MLQSRFYQFPPSVKSPQYSSGKKGIAFYLCRMLFNNYAASSAYRCQRLCGIGFHQTTPRLYTTTPRITFSDMLDTEGGAFFFLLFLFLFSFYFFVLSYVGQVVRDRQDQPSLKGILRLPVGAPPVFSPRRRTTPLRRRRRRLVASLSMAQAQH